MIIAFILVSIFTLFFVLLFYFYVITPFVDVRKYIKTEISRSVGSERKYWQKELRELYFDSVPVFGKIRKLFKKKER